MSPFRSPLRVLQETVTIYKIECFLSPLIGPGFVSTSPAITSNKDSANNRVGVAHTFLCWPHEQHRSSLPTEKSVPFPVLHTPVATFPTSQSSSRPHNRGTSEITDSRCTCSGTRGWDPQCAWYHRSFLFSQWPILARHSSGPLGGIFEIIEKDCNELVFFLRKHYTWLYLNLVT